MSKANLLPGRPAHATAMVLVPSVLVAASPAFAETQAGVGIGAEVLADSRPFLVENREADVAGSIRATPFLRTSSGRTTFRVDADLMARRFSKASNGSETSANAGGELIYRPSSYVNMFASGRFSSVLNGIGFGNFTLPAPDAALPPITGPLPDVSLIGNRVRTETASANLGMSARLSPLDELTFTATASQSKASALIGRDFSFVNFGLSYSRTLSTRLAVIANVTYGRSNFLRTPLGDGSVVSPTLGIRLSLSPRLTINASGGVTFTESDLGLAGKVRTTQLAGTLNFCRLEERGSLCLSAARTAQPTVLGGIQTLSSVAISYTKRLAERDNFRLNLAYNGNSAGGNGPIAIPSSQLYNASATWAHSLNRRLSFDLTPSYARIHNFGRSFDNVRLLGSLRYSFGAIL